MSNSILKVVSGLVSEGFDIHFVAGFEGRVRITIDDKSKGGMWVCEEVRIESLVKMSDKNFEDYITYLKLLTMSPCKL